MANEKREEEIPKDRIVCRCKGYKEGKKCTELYSYLRKEAMEKIAKFTGKEGEPFPCYCTTCEYINYISEHKKEPKKYPNIKKVEDWLECMAYTGPTWDDPTGILNDGRTPLFVDIAGNHLTLDQWIEKYHNDPRIHLRKLHALHMADELMDKDQKRH